MPLATLPLALGAGLDRSTGAAAVSPATATDAINLYGRDQTMAVRPGFAGTGFPALPWGTDVCCIAPVRATGDVLYVLFDRTSRQVRVYRLNAATSQLQALGVPANGEWGTIALDAEWPVVLAAEAEGKVFFAHDEPTIAYRLPTVYYTPDATTPSLPGTLTTLEADLDADGTDAPVYFRGVVVYLDYLCGWGYGSEQAGEESRPEILRISQPNQPTVFKAPGFVVCGTRAEPIIACVPTQGVLAIGKAADAYRLVGTSPRDFRPELLDARYGAVSSRSAISLGDVGYWWSQDGPRLVLAAETVPAAQPLELIAPLPTSLPERGPDRTCFVVYDRERYTLEWLWPNLVTAAVRTTGFLLSRWVPNAPAWTYTVREQCVSCAADVYFSDAVQTPTVDGYASGVSAVDAGIAPDARYRRVTVTWTNNLALGNETVQIFTKPSGGDWSVALSVPVGDSPQSVTLETLVPLQDYDLAIRLVRLSTTAAGYQSGDPDLWTAPTAAGAKTTVTTSSATVVWGSASFTNAATPIALTWTSAQQGVPYLLEKDPGSGYVTVAADLVASAYSYTIPSGELGTTVTFRLTAKRGSIVGPTAGTLAVPMFITVAAPVWNSATWSGGLGLVVLSFSGTATSFEVQKSTDGATWNAFASIASGGSISPYAPTDAELAIGTLYFRIRGVTGASVSAWVSTGAISLATTLPAVTVLSATLTQTVAGCPTPSPLALTWTPPGGDSAWVRVYVSVDGGATYLQLGFAAASAGAASVSPFAGTSPLFNLTPYSVLYYLQTVNAQYRALPTSTTTPASVSNVAAITPPPFTVSADLAGITNVNLNVTLPSTPGWLGVFAGTAVLEMRYGGGSWVTLDSRSTVSGTSYMVTIGPPSNPADTGVYNFRVRSVYGSYETTGATASRTWNNYPTGWT